MTLVVALINDVVLLAKPALFNLYFLLAALPFGFVFAILVALARHRPQKRYAMPAKIFIYAFRGSPLFIQFFMFYTLMLALNRDYWQPWNIDWLVMSPLFIGPMVLMLNTSAYSAEIFYGALKAIPVGQLDAANALGLRPWQRLRFVVLPNILRLGWPAYTNEVVFLFHSTALVYLAMPVIDQQKDLMNKAGELFETDYNLFLHFGVAAGYFLCLSCVIFVLCKQIEHRLNHHLPGRARPSLFVSFLR